MFSKKALTYEYFISFVLIVATIIGMFTDHDVTAIAVIAGASVLASGTSTAFYYWKAKTENRAKYAQRFVLQFADKYGIDAAVQLAEMVLKD